MFSALRHRLAKRQSITRLSYKKYINARILVNIPKEVMNMSRRYGLIGEKLSHSFSKAIHEQLADYQYELIELSPDQLADFMTQKDFTAINVTIPYKQAVIPYLDEIDERAAGIGAVNTIVNKNGRLIGYNTDFDGVKALLDKNGTDVRGKTVLVLGTGGTCKTVTKVLEHLGAGKILPVSRSGKNGAITYSTALGREDVQIVFNTTPCGMYPHVEDEPIDLAAFPRLEAVFDAVYNPIATRLVQQGREMGLPADGGLYMLVTQAVRASELFLDKPAKPNATDRVYSNLLCEKRNIILTGMPGSGKSTVGKMLAKNSRKTLVDIDAEIERRAGRAICEIFEEKGEEAFRQMETELCREYGAKTGQIIATGGGTVLRDENVASLRQNGVLFFIDSPLENLQPGGGRPLSKNREALAKRYEERYHRYCSTADIIIRNDKTPCSAARKIREAAL